MVVGVSHDDAPVAVDSNAAFTLALNACISCVFIYNIAPAFAAGIFITSISPGAAAMPLPLPPSHCTLHELRH